VIAVRVAERQKQNVVQQRDLPPKQSLIDLDSNKSWKQSNNGLTPPTINPHQRVRATASSPSDKSHLRTLSIEERSTSETMSDRSQQKGIHSRQLGRNPTINESDENTRTLIHQQKVDSIQRSHP
jgi:hypothetical protein